LTAPMMLKVDQVDGQVTLTAWIKVSFIVRLMVLFIVPREMGIESGGLKLVMPRKIARTCVNKLVSQFGQPAIA